MSESFTSRTPNRSRAGWSAHLVRYRWLYVFLIPGMSYFALFYYVPMYGIVIAFKDFSLVRGILGSDWVGLKHFRDLFGSSRFIQVLANSVWISILQLIWGFPAPIILALLLNEIRSISYRRVLQTAIYLPHFISWVVVAGIVIQFTSLDGAINQLVRVLGGTPVSYLQSVRHFRAVLISAEIWKSAGWGTIVYLAAIAGISPELYEAAIIDGARRYQRVAYVTLPGIASTIAVLLILRSGSILRNGFEQVFLLYSPLVYRVADVLETYTYRVGLLEGRFSFATAVGLFQSVVGLALLLTTNYLARKTGGRGLW